MGSSTIDRAFFELNSNAPDVEKGFRSLLNAMAGTQDKVKAAQQKFQDLQNTHQTLVSSITRLETEHAKYSEVLNSGTQDVKKWGEANNEVKRISKELEDLDKKAVKSKEELANAQKKLSQATQAAGTNFQVFGQAVGNFITHPVQSAQAGLGSLVASMGPVAVGMGAIAAGVGAAAYAFHEMAAKAGELALGFKNASYSTGLTVETVQALERAGKERGLNNLVSLVERLNIQLGSKEGGPFTEALLKSGYDLKGTKDAIHWIEVLHDRYAQIPDATLRAQTAAGELGRRLFHDLGPVVLMDDNFREFIDTLKKSSAVMSGEAIDALAAHHLEIEKAARGWVGLKNRASEYWSNLEGWVMKAGSYLIESSSFLSVMAGMDKENPFPLLSSENLPGMMSSHQPVASSISKTDKNQERASIIAAADAVAAGGARELIGLQTRLNELQQQYTEAKSTAGGGQYNEKEINSLAEKIRLQKEAIADLERGDKAFKQLIADLEVDQAAARLASLNEAKTAHDEWQKIIDSLYKIRMGDIQENQALVNAAMDAFSKAKTIEKPQLLSVADVPGMGQFWSIFDKAKYADLNWVPLDKATKQKLDPGFKHDLMELTKVWDNIGNSISEGIVTGFKDGLGIAKGLAQGFLRDIIQISWSNTVGKQMSNLMAKVIQGSKGLSAAIPLGASSAASTGGALGVADFNNAASSATSVAANSKFFGVGGNAGAGLRAGAAIGGSFLLEDAFNRGGKWGAMEGAAGGALIGAAIGGPIGAGIGAVFGAIYGAVGGSEKRRREELERRAKVQESQLFTSPLAIDRVEAFGSEASMEAVTSLVGKEILYSSSFEDQVVKAVNKGIMNNAYYLADNIAYVSGS
jgi:hypothetical protein